MSPLLQFRALETIFVYRRAAPYFKVKRSGAEFAGCFDLGDDQDVASSHNTPLESTAAEVISRLQTPYHSLRHNPDIAGRLSRSEKDS